MTRRKYMKVSRFNSLTCPLNHYALCEIRAVSLSVCKIIGLNCKRCIDIYRVGGRRIHMSVNLSGMSHFNDTVCRKTNYASLQGL